MNDIPWQLRLVRKSVKKRDKLRLLDKMLTPDPSRLALDLGCAQGILSYFFRRKGGYWVSTDEDWTNIKSSRDILRESLVQTTGVSLPFKDQAFDLVLCPDYLEHLEADEQCLQEVSRVLKKDGELILIVPQTGRLFLLHKLRAACGLRLEFYGHKREGYSLQEAREKLRRAGLEPAGYKTYSRFFSEIIELLLNLAYIHFFSPGPGQGLRDGHIRPSTEKEFEARKKIFRIYSMGHPLVWIISRLDYLLFFLKGYCLIIRAKKGGEVLQKTPVFPQALL